MGLTPRDAGHLYSRRDVEEAAAEPTRTREIAMPTRAERQSAYADRLSQRLGRPVSPSESEERYRVYNYSTRYVRAVLTVESDDGSRERRHVTLTSDRPLTYAEVRSRVAAYADRTETAYGGTIVGVTLTSTEIYDQVNL